MGKQERHNIDTIANVLIDKLGEMEKTANRIEKASQQPLKVDTREIQQILSDKKKEERAILEDLRNLQEKNITRLPNWVIATLSIVFLIFTGLSLYVWKKAEQYEFQKARADHYEELYYSKIKI